MHKGSPCAYLFIAILTDHVQIFLMRRINNLKVNKVHPLSVCWSLSWKFNQYFLKLLRCQMSHLSYTLRGHILELYVSPDVNWILKILYRAGLWDLTIPPSHSPIRLLPNCLVTYIYLQLVFQKNYCNMCLLLNCFWFLFYELRFFELCEKLLKHWIIFTESVNDFFLPKHREIWNKFSTTKGHEPTTWIWT